MSRTGQARAGATGSAGASPAPRVSVIIPAYAEAGRVGETVRAAADAMRRLDAGPWELLVIDDGSPDDTAGEAEAAGARVVRLPRNLGKGGALARGLTEARGDLLLLLDADLRETASEAWKLLEPVRRGDAEMTIARFPRQAGPAGFGLVMRLARWGLGGGGRETMG
ncbi:MAG: glycosyltransferase, partial [Armatimonadota bacterium]